MKNREQVFGMVKESVERYLDGRCVDLQHDSVLSDEFDIDSTEMVCIAVDLERLVGVSLRGIKFGKLRTPDDIVDAVLEVMATPRAVEAGGSAREQNVEASL